MCPSHLQQPFDALLRFVEDWQGTKMLAQAKARYAEQTGELFAQDPAFERRIAAFLEWYALDVVQPDGERLVNTYLRRCAEARGDNAAVLQGLIPWQQSRLGLFALRKVRGDAALLLGLLDNTQQVVRPADNFLGCTPGQLFVGRLLQQGTEATLSDGICYLPLAAAGQVRKWAKGLHKAGTDASGQQAALLQLTFLANRCARYRHVDPKQIFTGAALAFAPAVG